MRFYNRTADSEGIDVKKSNESKEWNIFHFLYFLESIFRFRIYISNGFYHLYLNIDILNLNGVDYHFIISGISKRKALNL